jgi:uncharacterized protein (DUF1778 family)
MSKKKKDEVEIRTQLPIRVSEEEKKTLEAAAAAENLPTGTWMRTLCLKAAKQILKQA